MTNLQQKLESFQTGNALLRDDLNIARAQTVQLQMEAEELRAQHESMTSKHSKLLQVRV